MSYALGPVKPWVSAAANEIGPKFGVRVIYGFASGDGLYGYRDHPLGLALDFMVSDKATGDAIASYAQANQARLGVHYIIWYRRIWNIDRASEGWRPYSKSLDGTVNPHTNHVHVSFLNHAGTGGAPATDTGFTIPNPLAPLEDTAKAWAGAAEWVSNPHNWLRVGMFFLGVVFMIVGLMQWDKAGAVVTRAGKAVLNG